MSENKTQFSLLNPFSFSKISLPQIHCVRDEEPFIVRNVVDFALFCTPNCSSSFMVMIIYGTGGGGCDRKFALYKYGDHEWTKTDTGYYRYNQITHLNGRFYVIGNHKHGERCFVLQVERIQDSISTRIIAYDDPWGGKTWLAESCGALIMVFVKWRIEIITSHEVAESNYEFLVAELDLESGGLKKVSDLVDSAIFLGESFCSLVHQVSRHKYKSNHIYYLKYYCEDYDFMSLRTAMTRKCFKVHAFNMQDGTVDSLFEAPNRKAIWVQPSL